MNKKILTTEEVEAILQKPYRLWTDEDMAGLVDTTNHLQNGGVKDLESLGLLNKLTDFFEMVERENQENW